MDQHKVKGLEDGELKGDTSAFYKKDFKNGCFLLTDF